MLIVEVMEAVSIVKEYRSPELEICVLVQEDILNKSDTLIDVSTLFGPSQVGE